MGGICVSYPILIHGSAVFVQFTHRPLGAFLGILIRACA